MLSSRKKKDKRVWRRPNKKEGEKIISKLEYFGEKVPQEILRGHDIFILEIARKEAHLVIRELSDMIDILKPYASGITLGEFKGDNFVISLAGGFLVSKYATKKRVFLDKEGSIKYIYGEDVEGPDIVDWDEDVEDEDLVIVLDEKGEFLGFGRSIVKNLRVTGVRNVIDIGWYLRSEIDYE